MTIQKHLRQALLILFFIGTSAQASISTENLEIQRSQYLAAESALDQNDKKKYQQLKASLKNYPLLPYLEFKELQRAINSTSNQQIMRFMERYQDTPLHSQIRRRWLKHLAKKQQWKSYLQFYQPKMGRIYLCHQIQALLKTGKTNQALDLVQPVWLSSHTQPDACDPALDAWRQAGRLTPKLAWQRVVLAMQASQTGFANYLARYLNAEQKKLLLQWQRLYRVPKEITQLKLNKKSGETLNPILLHVFKRLVKANLEQASKAWPILSKKYHFSNEQRYQAERRLLLKNIRSEGNEILAALDHFTPDANDVYLQETRIRAALRQQDWDRVFKWIELLPANNKSDERWRYWRAVALKHQGKKKQAISQLESLANERSYHGFLAADRLNKDYRFSEIPLQLSEDKLNQIEQHAGVQRARELFHLKKFIAARREWQLAVKSLTDKQLQLASKLAQSWGWHDRAIFTLARTGYWDDLKLRFPLAHHPLVAKGASNNDLDEAWVFAVIRQESAFSTDARSPAGARGLMQLMPKTARFISRKTNHKKPTLAQLYQPTTNIQLGTAYLSRVFDQLGNHQALATAAYNAGPHRVRSWLPPTSLAADIWVETIPFQETRRYTERVLSYTTIYEQQLGKNPTTLSSRLDSISPNYK